MSEHNAQQSASPTKAQDVVNVAPGEGPSKDVSYDDFVKQLTDLEKQLDGASTSEAMDALKAKISALEDEIAKKATKKGLSRKLSEMKKMMEPEGDKEDDDSEDDEDSEAEEKKADSAEADAKEDAESEVADASNATAKHRGKGIVAVNELQGDVFGSNAAWFKDLLKANQKAKAGSFK